MGLFVFVIDSPVMNTPGRRLESLGEVIFQTKITCQQVVKVTYSQFLE